MIPNTNAMPDVQPALTSAPDWEMSASLRAPVLPDIGIWDHPALLGPLLFKGAKQAHSRASDGLINGPACPQFSMPAASFLALSAEGS